MTDRVTEIMSVMTIVCNNIRARVVYGMPMVKRIAAIL